MQCPKCRKEIADTAAECPHCHIQVRMYLKKMKQKAEDAKKGAATPAPEVKSGSVNPVMVIIVVIVASIFGYYHFVVKGKRVEARQSPVEALAPVAAPVEKLPTLEDVQPPEEKPESAISGQEAVGKVDKIIERTSPFLIGHPKPPSQQN